jgi:regulatory protein
LKIGASPHCIQVAPFMSFSDKPREPRAPRKARPGISLKMQAIGFLSRREHSRQELRAKLLESLRKRAREEAALVVASERAAKELEQALNEQPSNGIDDAFAPVVVRRVAEPAAVTSQPRRSTGRASPPSASDRAPTPRFSRDGDSSAGRDDESDFEALPGDDWIPDGEWPADGRDAEPGSRRRGAVPQPLPASSALDGLRLASGAALPARLKATFVAAAAAGGRRGGAAAFLSTGVQVEGRAENPDADLERTDPETAVDQLLDWLVANKYLSETRFVESRVNARARKQGTMMIKHELSRHGLALEPEQAAQLRETEFARAQALWQRKFGTVAGEARERARQARFLASRGFAADVVRRIVGGAEEF